MIDKENGVYPEPEPDFNDPPDYVDSISDQELLGDLLKQKPQKYDGLSASVVIDGLPQVPVEKLEKLKSVVNKVISKYGTPVTSLYPEDNGTIKGYAFIEFENATQAMSVVKGLEKGHRLDKQHTMLVNAFHDITKYSDLSGDWIPPKPQEYVDRGNLKYWLLEPNCYDQYGVVHEGGGVTTIYLNSTPEPQQLVERPRWTESVISWSPLGTYLATCHQRGIVLWAGEEFQKIQKYEHEEVAFWEFSPQENYLVTFSPTLAQKGDQHAIIIWEVRSGAKKRWFPVDEANCTWPMFKWSHDDKYFAKMGLDALSIYAVNENPPFGLLDKKSIKLKGIKGFNWSPSENTVAYWVAEDQNSPARVNLLEIPTKAELRSKNLFNVADCKMYWQKQGDFLCVQVHRYLKAKKEKNEMKYSGLYYNYEIFHLREKLIPVDSFEIKETVVNFAWEPVGSKFGIIVGDTAQHAVLFYELKAGKVQQLKRFENKACNQLFWSPAGQFVLLASPRAGMNRSLEWIDTSDMTVTAKNEHFLMTDVEWDPTGRYVTTMVSWWEHKADNSYWLWSFNGRLIRKHNLNGFCQLLWRPRPPTLLSAEKIAETKKNLKNYSNQFDSKDKAASNQVSRTQQERRKRLVEEFKQFMSRKKKAAAAMMQEMQALRDPRLVAELSEVVDEEPLQATSSACLNERVGASLLGTHSRTQARACACPCPDTSTAAILPLMSNHIITDLSSVIRQSADSSLSKSQ
ncbi:Eukaryotic translation initiation factor 3 subunit B, partial [Fragariocoptes setiger]